MKEKSIVGDLINFRGLVYSPMNENGVIFLFGKVMEDLNMYVEEIKPGFPDCMGRRFTGKGWEKILIEFEFKSSNFKAHGHDPKKCDIVVCWEHDWSECPIEVIELKEVINTLENIPIERPNKPDIEKEKYSINDLNRLFNSSNDTQNLFKSFDNQIKNINDEIWSKVGKRSITYYSPERVFIFAIPLSNKIRYDLFTDGLDIDGTSKKFKISPKWRSILLENEDGLSIATEAANISYKLIKKAIKSNKPIY